MLENRRITRLIKSQITLEGAGVHLKRFFGFGNTDLFLELRIITDWCHRRKG